MPRYFVEHNIPRASQLTPPELESITQQCLGVLHSQMQWVSSTVTEDRIYCLYEAQDQKMVMEHARHCGMPIKSISIVSAIIDPLTFNKDK